MECLLPPIRWQLGSQRTLATNHRQEINTLILRIIMLSCSYMYTPVKDKAIKTLASGVSRTALGLNG